MIVDTCVWIDYFNAMIRSREKAPLKKIIGRNSQTRTNIHIDTNLVQRISSRTILKSRRAIVDFALRTTAELLERREKITGLPESMFGLTRGTVFFLPVTRKN